ncbi:protein FAM217B [Pimephales promelas]|nr:protein FAM217B [Pimephales promelas]
MDSVSTLPGLGLDSDSSEVVSTTTLEETKTPGDSQQRFRRTRPDKMLITANTTHRQHNTKIKSHATSNNGQKERQQKQTSSGAKETGNGDSGKSSSVRPVKVQREDEEEGCTLQSKPREEDSASDLSDSERYSVFPAGISPPDLDLRAEVIDPSDIQTSSSKLRGSYPDFLPPPFNSWSLQQLAVYLNTDGKNVPRPKPVGKLERYLDRLLQIEWHQIRSVQEESSKSNTPMPKARHSSSHLSLSSPKCILQCQRAFPLTLLSSLATRQLLSCSCPQCQNQYLILNGSCRSHAFPHHTLLEKKRQALPKRSSSESRAHPMESRHRSREHRLSDPLSDSSHWRRMQAVGNIRNPAGSTRSPERATAAGPCDGRKRRPGERSRSCVGVKEIGFTPRGHSEQWKSCDPTQSCADPSEALQTPKHSATGPLTRKQKHVAFVTM